MTGQTPRPTLSDCRELLARLRQAADQAVCLVCEGDPAEGVVTEMERMAAEAQVMLGAFSCQAGGVTSGGRPRELLAELSELLAESLRHLRTAQEYARVIMEGMQRELEGAAQGQRGLRAYQAALADRPETLG